MYEDVVSVPEATGAVTTVAADVMVSLPDCATARVRRGAAARIWKRILKFGLCVWLKCFDVVYIRIEDLIRWRYEL